MNDRRDRDRRDRDRDRAKREAVEVLKDILTDGPVPAGDIIQNAEDAGICAVVAAK